MKTIFHSFKKTVIGESENHGFEFFEKTFGIKEPTPSGHFKNLKDP